MGNSKKVCRSAGKNITLDIACPRKEAKEGVHRLDSYRHNLGKCWYPILNTQPKKKLDSCGWLLFGWVRALGSLRILFLFLVVFTLFRRGFRHKLFKG